jgi:hypothetical protein
MITYEEPRFHLILDDRERNTFRIICETFAKQNKDSDIPITVNCAKKMAEKLREK